MLNWPNKSPGETLDFAVDWANELKGGEAIASYDFAVSEGTVSIGTKSLEGVSTVVFLSGGKEGEHAVIRASIVTDQGRDYEQCVGIDITACGSCAVSSTTKKMLIGQMFDQVALNGWEYDIEPEETGAALIRLDMMMWELKGRGIDVGYNFPRGIGQGSPEDDLGCSDQAFFGLALLGAERLCPTMGKTQSKEGRIALNAALKAVRSAATQLVPDMRLRPGTPRGSGNPGWLARRPYTV